MTKKIKVKIVFIFIVLGLTLSAGWLWYLKLGKQNRRFEVRFFNVGQGDAALIFFKNGQKMLVDCGLGRGILSKLGQALPFYDRTIDFLVVTHPDNDHYGGCADVLKRYEVRHIITNGVQKINDPDWSNWKEAVKKEGAVNTIIVQAEKKEIGGAKIEFLAPDKDLDIPEDENDNDHSIVFRLTYDRQSFLFMGDAETPLEDALLKKYCLPSTPCPALSADYLKVGHHGSDTSSGSGFLSAVSPEVAVVSVGKNRFGHPSFRTLRKLERAGARVLRTDEEDDIIIEE